MKYYVLGIDKIADNNFVSNAALPAGGGSACGIDDYDQDSPVKNAVSNFVYGIMSNGGIYAYNTVNNCTTSFYGHDGAIAGAGNSP